MKINFELKKRIGTLSNRNGYTKELNLVDWGGEYLKYDVRLWMSDGKPGKGITLTKAEAKELRRLLNEEDLG